MSRVWLFSLVWLVSPRGWWCLSPRVSLVPAWVVGPGRWTGPARTVGEHIGTNRIDGAVRAR
ncbi:MAG: hypothetical protein ABS80_26860 [Pseudonocardia sp. SCN 72-51]|nr:MAG: hypothetical protein ABS80_26860 [Pseudonocardia sp. SCN 72-51]